MTNEFKKGTVVYSYNRTNGLHFVGVVLKIEGYNQPVIQFASSLNNKVQTWTQRPPVDSLTIIGEMPEGVEWDACNPDW